MVVLEKATTGRRSTSARGPIITFFVFVLDSLPKLAKLVKLKLPANLYTDYYHTILGIRTQIEFGDLNHWSVELTLKKFLIHWLNKNCFESIGCLCYYLKLSSPFFSLKTNANEANDH
jgi:hypothetical protein